MSIPAIEQAKIQARVLVPLVRAMQAELGKERANAIVRKALGDMYRQLSEKWWRAQGGNNLGDIVASAFERYRLKALLITRWSHNRLTPSR